MPLCRGETLRCVRRGSCSGEALLDFEICAPSVAGHGPKKPPESEYEKGKRPCAPGPEGALNVLFSGGQEAQGIVEFTGR